MKETVRLETQSSAVSWLLRAICKPRGPYTHVATSPKSKQNMQIKPSLGKPGGVLHANCSMIYHSSPHCKQASGLEMNGKEMNAQNPLHSLTVTLSLNLIIDWTLTPHVKPSNT